jgi:hypothetical protein
MRWHEPLVVIVAVLLGAYLVSKWPQLNILGKVLP